MKKIEVVKVNEVEVKPFVLDEFIQKDLKQGMTKKVTKKELKYLADDLNLVYDDTVSYTHLTLPTNVQQCRSRWSPDQ